MLTRFAERFYLTRGEKSALGAYVLVAILTAFVALIVMSGVDAPYALSARPDVFVYWVAIAGAMSGAVALYFSRGWMGGQGMLGFVRSLAGLIAVAVIASIMVGTLTVPFAGTVYGPLILLSFFIATPWLAVIWVAGMCGAHYLMTILQEERAYGLGRNAHRSVTSQLSSLSRAQLYHRD